MDYDIGEAFQRIEDEMLASMSRNLKRHLKKEKEEGLNYAMWQAEQLKALDEFKKNNAKAFKDYFGIVNEQLGQILEVCNKTGQLDQEAKILEAIQEGWDAPKAAKGIQGTFFKINERKMNALINATKKDMAKAQTAMLRQANDVYRKTIYNAQVYYNSGAGTLSQCVDMATKDFLAKGITCVEYANGAMVGIDSYARMVLRTTQLRSYLYGEAAKRDEWGINTVILNKRGNACPLCMKWVGQVYYDDVYGHVPIPSPEKYTRLSVAFAGGLGHPNCKDKWSTYFEGISTPPTPPTKAQKDEANRVYMLEQRQRYNERQIRKFKRLVTGSVDPDNVLKYSQKLSHWKEVQKNFIEENSDVLKRRAELEKVFELPENLQWGQNTYDFSQKNNDIINTNKNIDALAHMPNTAPMEASAAIQAKTFDELEDYFRKKYNISFSNGVRNLDFDSVKESCAGIDRVLDEFPAVRNTFKDVSDAAGGAGIMATSYDGTIKFNPYTYKTRQRALNAHTQDSYHIKGNSLFTTGAHEAGHLLERFLIDNGGGTVKDWKNCIYAKSVVKDALAEILAKYTAEGHTPPSPSSLIEAISEYATEDASECLAEAVADCIQNEEQASELSQLIWDILKKRVQ